MTPPVPHRAVTTVLTLAVPLALAAVPFVVATAWASELPDPVAVHFGTDGPDGFSSLAGAVWPTAIATVAVALGSWALAFFWGRTALVRRTAAGTAVGMAAFLSTLVVGMLDLQRGLADAAQTGRVRARHRAVLRDRHRVGRARRVGRAARRAPARHRTGTADRRGAGPAGRRGGLLGHARGEPRRPRSSVAASRSSWSRSGSCSPLPLPPPPGRGRRGARAVEHLVHRDRRPPRADRAVGRRLAALPRAARRGAGGRS